MSFKGENRSLRETLLDVTGEPFPMGLFGLMPPVTLLLPAFFMWWVVEYAFVRVSPVEAETLLNAADDFESGILSEFLFHDQSKLPRKYRLYFFLDLIEKRKIVEANKEAFERLQEARK